MEHRPPSPERLRDVLAGRYRLEERAGAGGMATIYRARDLTLDRTVAVKVLHPHLMDDHGVRERFRTEARHAAKLLHPNIVNVFDTGDSDGPGGPPDGFPAGLPWIVMEYVDGPSLRDVLRERGRLRPGEALAIVEPVAHALARAHAAGLVHRDVKPENVLIAADGTPKVADFGIARALAETSHTQTGTLIGSVHYMAPELVSGKPATAASDQYAVGILLYELLTGRQPLPGETPMAIALRHAQEPVPAVSAENPDVTPALDAVVARATALAPEQRFEDLSAFAAAFRTAVPGGAEPVVVHARDDDGSQHTLVIPPGSQETAVVPPAPARSWLPDTRKRSGSGGPRGSGTRRGRLVRAPLLAVPLLALAALALWAFVLAPPVTVPDLRSMTLEEARAELDGIGLLLAEGEPVHDREIAEGGIVEQDPAADGRVRRGEAVTVRRSLGPLIVGMPDVVGETEEQAQAQLGAHGFAVEVNRGWHDAAPAGTVAGQQPAPGTDIPEGGPVVIYVSQGIEQVQVPALAGMDQDEAAAALEAAKLTARFVPVYSDDVPEAGAVISQSLEAGATVDKGTEVEVQVSRGPLTIAVPNVEGRDIEDGVAALQALDLRVVVVEEPRPRVGPFRRGAYGRVEAQDPQPGTRVRRGDTVTLYTFSRAAEDGDEDDDD